MPPESPLEKLRRLERAEAEARRAGRARGNDTKTKSETDTFRGKLSNRRGWIGGVVVVLIVILTKLKWILAAVKLQPILLTMSTMGASMWLYATQFGWKFAVGFVLLILIHELGHGVAAWTLGLRTGAPIFIPFFGAVIALKDQPRSAGQNAIIALAGPAAGLAGAVACWTLLPFFISNGDDNNLGENKFAVSLAWTTFYINLFNLIPVFGLDGDHATRMLRPAAWLAVLGAVAALFVIIINTGADPNPLLIFIMICGAVQAFRAYRSSRNVINGRAASAIDRLYDAMRPSLGGEYSLKLQLLGGAAYLLLVTMLSLGALFTFNVLHET